MSNIKALRTSIGLSRVEAWEWASILLLVLIGVLSRLPFQSQVLYHWDSINFARALEHFDIAQGQPHAPGYLLYVLLGRGAAWLTGDAQTAYVLLAILGSALAAAALYDLGRQMWDVRVGWVAALLLLSSPLFWFYSEVALPHTLDALAVIVAAALSWRAWHGERRAALLLAFWLGLAGGFRPQTLVFLFPLAVIACIRLPLQWIAGALIILGVTVLAWLVPLFALSGGMANYLHIVSSYSEHFNRSTSVFLGAGWSGVSYNLDKLFRYTLWGWALGGVLMALGIWWLRRPLHVVVRSWRVWLLVLWAVPCLLFYTLIHMGQQGLIFVYLPILMLLSARASTEVMQRWRWGIAVVMACIVGNALLYLFASSQLPPGQFKVLSLATAREHDALVQAQIDVVRNDLPPDAVLLSRSWRFPEYYVPEVPLVRYEPDGPKTAEDHAHIERATMLAWYEPDLDLNNQAQNRTMFLEEHNGVQLRVLERAPDEQFYVMAGDFGIKPRTP